MKGIRIAVTAWTICAIYVAPAFAFQSPELCIVRPGENGSLNVLPVTVIVRDLAELTINGEEEICLKPFVYEATNFQIRLRFAHPYRPWNMPEDWTTPGVSIFFRPGSKTVVMLCPRVRKYDANWDKSGWHDTWVISPPEKREACGPLYAKLRE